MSAARQHKAGPGELAKRLINAIRGFIEDDMVTYAAALAYQAFFSLFPFVIFLLALLGLLNIPGFFDRLLDQARAVLPEQAMGVVEQVIGQIRGQSSGELLSLGIIIALWVASSGVRMLMNALNVAYDVDEERPIWKRFPLSIFYTIVLAIVIIVAVGLMLVGPQVVEWLAEQIGLGALFVTLWAWLRLPVAILLLMVVVALGYYLLPNTDQRFRFITPGAVLAVIGWIAASLGFSFYVSNFASYSATYGSLGAVIVLLLYFFVSAAVLLFGAEVNAQIYYHFAESEDEGEKTQEASQSDE